MYSPDGDILQVTPYTDSVPECIAIRLLQTLYNVSIPVNNSHFHNVDQKILFIDMASSLTYNTVLIGNCLYEIINQFIITQNTHIPISNCSLKFLSHNWNNY